MVTVQGLWAGIGRGATCPLHQNLTYQARTSTPPHKVLVVCPQDSSGRSGGVQRGQLPAGPALHVPVWLGGPGEQAWPPPSRSTSVPWSWWPCC